MRKIPDGYIEVKPGIYERIKGNDIFIRGLPEQIVKLEESMKPSEPMITSFTCTPSSDLQKLNKTERAYYNDLMQCGYMWIGIQNVTLKLADDTRYTCDFMCIDNKGAMHGKEVKGFFRDDAKVKIKVAARMFPWIKFTIIKKRKGGGWDVTEVKP